MKYLIKEAFYIWATFDPYIEDYLKKLMEQTNSELYGPNFVPHLTLSGPIHLDKTRMDNFLNKLSSKIRPIPIQLEEIEMKDTFFQSLFIRVKKSKLIMTANKMINKQFNLFSDEFFPHISLYYGNADITKKLMVKEKVQLPRTKLKLDRLSLVHIREKIENWEILKTYHLKD